MDRNPSVGGKCKTWVTSLSARRAWIEIKKNPLRRKLLTVALRKESVDRNDDLKVPESVSKESLSARRAWIEIGFRAAMPVSVPVALRKESVDRNGCLLDWDAIGYTSLSARRAWIEIGYFQRRLSHRRMSLSARRAWIEIISALV